MIPKRATSQRIVHLYPTRRCNLACLHCDTESGPKAEGALPLETLNSTLNALHTQGYTQLYLSGGEPLVYPQIGAVTATARALGFHVTGISNGFRVGPRFAARLNGFHSLSISFDGLRDLHDRMRGNQRAWDMGLRALRYLKENARPGSVTYTATAQSLEDLPDFVEIAAALGVSKVHVVALRHSVRIAAAQPDAALQPPDLKRLHALTQTLARTYAPRVSVVSDTCLGVDVRPPDPPVTNPRLSDLVPDIAITADGDVRPFAHDFPNRYALGTCDTLTNDPAQALQRAAPLSDLLHSAVHHANGTADVIDWPAFLSAHASKMIEV